jgi:hypothetical protein
MKKTVWCETALEVRDIFAEVGWRLERIGSDHPAYAGRGQCYLVWRPQGRHEFLAWHDLRGRSLLEVQDFAFCLLIAAQDPSYDVLGVLQKAGCGEDYI